MKTIRKNRKEDLKLLIDLGENYHGEDVTFTFSAGRYGVETYVCSYIGGEAVNLVVTGTAMLCLLDNHRLPLGTLSVEIDIRVPDTQMPDGDFRHVTRKAAAFSIGGEQCTVELTNGASDYFPEELVPEAVINLLPTVIKGDPGQDADIEGCNQAIAAMVALTEDVEMSESKRAESEQQRMDSEAERTAAENDRKAAENERAAAETQRQTAEALRTEAEKTRTSNETARQQNENERTKDETARQTAENLRVSNETKRTESETARTEAEKARAAAETSRTQAEDTRIQKENERQTAEQERIVNNENCVTATNTALTAAGKATAAANNATTDANNAAGEANAAAERANEAADLVYNGPDENVSVACYTNVEGASTAGLVLNVYINENTVPQQYTTDENGLTAFKVTKGLRYDIVFPDIEGCSPIGRMSFTAALQTRGIEVTYQPLQKTQQEHVTISFRRYEENATWQGGTVYPDGVAHVTIDGVETTYHADSNGMADFFVDLGKEYTVQIEKPTDLHLVNGVYNATYTADRSARVIAISFHAYLSDFLIVDANGSEWTYDGFINSGKDPSEAILIHVATEELLAAGCDYYLSLHVLAYGKYHGTTTSIPSKSWAAQTVQFTSVPANPSVDDPLYYDGYKSTYLIINEGLDRGIATDCHTFTTRETIQLGLDTLYGYTPTKGQYEPLVANYDYINDMVLYARPDGNPVSNFWDKSKGTSTQQSATNAYYVRRYVSNINKSYGHFSPFPAYAKTSL